MDSYQSGDDMRQVGIHLLTGEACGLYMRILCDLDADGIKLWETFTRSKVVSDGWGGEKASVMIPQSMFEELWIFGQVMKDRKHVFLGGHVHEWKEEEITVGYDDDGEPIKEMLRTPAKGWTPTAFATDSDERMQNVRDGVKAGYFYIARTYTKSDHPGTGLDNQHAMSGRTV